jgi:hypothetical protein
MLVAEVGMPEGDLSRADVERYLRVNRGGRGLFVGITGIAGVIGLIVGFAVARPDEHLTGRKARRDRSAALMIAGVFGAVGLGVAVLTDNLRRRAQLGGLTGDQIRRLDQALIDNADVNAEVDRALIERTLQRANRV